MSRNPSLAAVAALASRTPEQQAASREKSRLVRAANVAARAASPLRKDFLDAADRWLELAKRCGVRLPAWGIPITPGAIRRWLRKLDYTVEWYKGWQGEQPLGDFARRNPLWPMRALVGLMLEEREADDACKEAVL